MAAILKTVKSPYLRNRSTDSEEKWHSDTNQPPAVDWPLKFWIFGIVQDGGGRHVENHKNRDISATVWPTFMKFGKTMQKGSLHHRDR